MVSIIGRIFAIITGFGKAPLCKGRDALSKRAGGSVVTDFALLKNALRFFVWAASLLLFPEKQVFRGDTCYAKARRKLCLHRGPEAVSRKAD